MTTPNLTLPELSANQAQPHITINSALRILDAIVQLSVEDIGVNTPPVSPVDGETQIVGETPTGDWSVFSEGSIAVYTGGAWIQLQPIEGWLAWVKSEDALYRFGVASPNTNGGWTPITSTGGSGSTGNASIFSKRVACCEFSTASPTPLNGLVATRTATTTTAVAASAGGADLVAYVPRLRSQSGTSANSATQARFVENASTMLRAATRSEAATAGTARFVFSPYALNSDSRAFYGLCADAISGVMGGSTEPSARTNIVALGFDSGDSNWQWITNDGSGTATKTDLGITKASLVGKLVSLVIELTGTDVVMTLVNMDTGAEYTTTITSDLPAIDTYLAMALFTGTGPTTVSVGHEMVYCAQEHAI